MGQTRREKDFLGERDVPAEAYWGIQTLRAVENFPVSGLRAHPAFVHAMAAIKKAAAQENADAGRLDPKIAAAIVRAADEILAGKWLDQFVVDAYQAGAGTSSHMNMNEVLANRGAEILGGRRGDYALVHPNDHANLGQSTNDVYPTAMRLAALMLIEKLRPVLVSLHAALEAKAAEFKDIVKSGRTHLRDATPLTLGQEFGGYAEAVRRGEDFLRKSAESLLDLGIGGTAVGTGVLAHAGYREAMIRRLDALIGSELGPGVKLRAARNMFEAMQSNAPFALVSGALRALALDLIRIANDLRLLSSGPNTGLAEIELPAVQPGSSIMPGKTNPVIAEALTMVCFQVAGNDLAISLAVQAGQLELNVMMPVINHNLLQSLEILRNAVGAFTERCVKGISADAEKCRAYALKSSALATLLRPALGYEKAAELAREAERTGKSIAGLALEKGVMTAEDLEKLLSHQKV